MSPRNKGGGKTPDSVVELLRNEVARTSQAATARATGLTLKGVQNYLKGIGEPTTATLQKLADYFGVLVPWLQGHFGDMSYEAAKEHRKAVESGQRSGWVGDLAKIQVSVQERVDDLLFMSRAFLALAKSGLLEKEKDTRKEYLKLMSDMLGKIEAMMPLVEGENEIALRGIQADLKSAVARLEKSPRL